jgi:hypothetical protein
VPGWAKNELWRRARAVPSLDLRFAENKSLVDAVSGQSLVTFTRASSGTYVGSDGLIKTATTDEPRFDHDPVTGESLGLLVEEQRTNLLTYSEDFENAVWQTTNPGEVTLITGVADPAGGNNATTFYHDAGAGDTGWLRRLSTGTVGQPYTLSFWARRRAGTGNLIAVAGDNINQNINGVTSSWQKFFIFNTPTSSTFRSYIKVDSAGDQFDIWGVQLEASAFPTSYIPTTSSTVTRSAEPADVISAAIANDIRTLYLEFRSPASGTRGVASLNDNTADERASVITSGTDPKLVVVDGGVEQANIDGGTVTTSARTRVAVRINTNDFSISVNGGTPVTDTSGTLPTVDRLMLGRTQSGEYLNGALARVVGWRELLADSTLQELSQ